MSTLKEQITEVGLSDHILTDSDLNNLFDGTPAARYGLVNKAIKKDEIIKVRRGLYVLADKYRHQKLSKYCLANRIAPHSYISMESALSYHGWIPEYVPTVTSMVCMGRSRQFKTPSCGAASFLMKN